MSENKARPTIAFLLSASIHTLLFAGIVYTGLDIALPEGTVSSTEVEFVSGPIPQGNQSKNTSMKHTSVAKTVKPKTNKKAPPPPPPPSEDIAEDNPDEGLAILKEPTKQKKAKPLRELVKEKESQQKEDPLDKYFDENNDKENESETVAENSDADEAYNELDKLEEQEYPVDEDRDGNALNDELAYGNSAGVKSDKELVPVPGNAQPSYPMFSRLRRQEGSVVLSYDVLSDGSVSNIELVQSSGYERLDASAIEAHKKWRYRPGKTGRYQKSYIFSLKGKAEEAPARLRRSKN